MQSRRSLAKSALRRAGLYHRIRNSGACDLYFSVTKREMIEDRRSEINFYAKVLVGFRKGDIIFDIGANVGQKTRVFLDLGARVVAIEPDEQNQRILHESFINYRFTPKPVVVVGQAVSEQPGIATMLIDGAGSALNTLSTKWADAVKLNKRRFEQTTDACTFAAKKTVATTTIDQLVEQHGTPFFIKIDVEGHELNVLRGMRRPVPYLSFEVNLPEFRAEGIECLSILDTLAKGEFNYAIGNTLALANWMNRTRFVEVLSSCSDSSIDVFWRSLC